MRNKENLKKLRGLLFGIGACALAANISGCKSDTKEPENKTITFEEIKESKYRQGEVGFFKNGEEYIPYYRGYGKNEVYNLLTFEKIGKYTERYKFPCICNENEEVIYFANAQMISFYKAHQSDIKYDTICKLTDKDYETLVNQSHIYINRTVRIFELEEEKTGNKKSLIGYKINETKMFDLETWEIKDYTGWNIINVERYYLPDKNRGYSFDEISLYIKSCKRVQRNMNLDLATIEKEMKLEDDLKEATGFIKNGEEYIPYYSLDSTVKGTDGETYAEHGYYNYKNGEYIGYKFDDVWMNTEVVYNFQQIFSFDDYYPYVNCNYEMMNSLKEEDYKDLVDGYFANHKFYRCEIRVYKILNLTTNELQYIIGDKVRGQEENETRLFNYETYKIEDYAGYAIKDMNVYFEKFDYNYSEILEFIANYREQNQSLTLERK